MNALRDNTEVRFRPQVPDIPGLAELVASRRPVTASAAPDCGCPDAARPVS